MPTRNRSSSVRSLKVMGLGEVLWDLLPSGKKIGGAPTNFAYHAHALGAEAAVISRVGRDDLGREMTDRIRELGLPVTEVQWDESAPTGTVSVSISRDGIPEYIIHENTAWDRLAATDSALASVRDVNALCFGSLAQRDAVARDAIRRLMAEVPNHSLRVFDINLRQHFYSRDVIESSLRLANILKLNEDELPIVAGLFQIPGSIREQIQWLANTWDLRVVVLTLGANGSLIFQEGDWSEMGPARVQVVDTVGAGDAFTAAMVMGLLHGGKLPAVHAFASEVAGFVCSRDGATPPLPLHLSQHFFQHQI